MEKESVSEWMDAEAVRALAESLLEPAPGNQQASPEVDLGEGFVGFAEVPGSKKSQAPAPSSSVSLRAESLKEVLKPKPAKAVSLKSSQVVYVSKTNATNPYPRKAKIESPFTIAPNQVLPPIPGKAGSQSAREDALRSFGRWLKKNIPTGSFFVCSPDGRVAMDEMRSDKLIRVARDLVSESNDGGTSHHVKIGEDKVLEVIEVKAERGTSILGIIVPRPLSESAVAAVSNALVKALADS